MNARKHILVVEDERIVARDIQRTLVDFGYQVPTTASSGEQALQLVGDRCPDLVLMDIRLGGAQDGIETAAILQAKFAVPIVYLTSYADAPTVDRAKATQPLGYLLKPVTADALRNTVELALVGVALPWCRGDASLVQERALAAKPRGYVLVVDGEAMVRSALQRALGDRHFLTCPKTPSEALALIDAGMRFDLILCDLATPGLSGAVLHGELDRRHPDQARRTVFLTGGAISARLIEFLQATSNQCLEKPFEPRRLRAVVDTLLLEFGVIDRTKNAS